MDGTQIKVATNNHKYRKEIVNQQTKFMSDQPIDLERRKYERKYLKPSKENEAKEKKISTIAPESGWFHKRGYKEVFAFCPLLSVCTQSQNHQKVIRRHIWKDDLEFFEEIRHQKGKKELYKKRKETIDRLFGTG